MTAPETFKRCMIQLTNLKAKSYSYDQKKALWEGLKGLDDQVFPALLEVFRPGAVPPIPEIILRANDIHSNIFRAREERIKKEIEVQRKKIAKTASLPVELSQAFFKEILSGNYEKVLSGLDTMSTTVNCSKCADRGLIFSGEKGVLKCNCKIGELDDRAFPVI